MVAALKFLKGIDPVGHIGKGAQAIVAGKPGEVLRLWEGQGPEKNRVDDAEDDDVGSDAEGEDENGDDGEAAIPAEIAEGVAEILEKDFESGDAAGFALIFFGLLRATEVDEGLATGLGGRHASLEIFFDGQVEMDPHLRVKILIELRATEE